MNLYNILDCKYNKIITENVFSMIIIKGASMLVSLLLFPAYISYFGDNRVLGVWFTLVSILNWILIFDLGLGNGLRNNLPRALVEKDFVLAKRLVSSTYVSTIILSFAVFFSFFFGSFFVDWNQILGISINLISSSVLLKVIHIISLGIFLQFILKIISSILFALQKSAVNNLIGLLSNIIILVFIKILDYKTISEGLMKIAVLNVFATNIPLFIFSIWIFYSQLREIRPSLSMFNISIAKKLLSIGVTILWLQLIFLVVSNMNEVLVSSLCGAGYVVQYQAYNKIYSTGAVIFSLALTPVWSAVTSAQHEKNYKWIKEIYKFFMICSFICLLLEVLLTFFGQVIFNLWLGNNIIEFNFYYGLVFSLHSFLFIIHNVNTSISNGLSYFKCQIYGMTFAAILFIPIAYLLTMYLQSWIGVILASCVSILFYEIVAPYFTLKYLNNIG